MSATGILDAAYVVFYHPLDNFTEKTQNQTWTGTGGFVAGKVAPPPPDAFSAITSDAASIGTPQVVGTGDTAPSVPMGAAPLDSTRFVAAYKGGSGTKAFTRVVTVSGSAFTLGTEFELAATIDATSRGVRVAALTSTLVVYCYHNGVTLAVRAGTVSGDDITLGAVSTAGMWNGFFQDVVALDSAKFAVVSAHMTGGNRDVRAIAGSVSGGTITLGTSSLVETIASTGTTVAAAAIDSARVLVAYQNSAALGQTVWCRVATVSGLDITVDPALAAATSDGQVGSVVRLTSTKLVILFSVSSIPRHKAVVATVSGADLTFGAAGSRLGSSSASIRLRASRLTDSTFVDSDAFMTVAIGTVSGASVTYGGTTSIAALGDGTTYDVAALAANKFFILGGDDTDTEGAVGTLDTTATMTAPTPGAYPTAVGATRVVAAMWAQKLTAGSSIVTVERGYKIDMTATSISLGGTTAVWNDSGIASLMASMNSGVGEAAKHLLVLDFENTGGTGWNLRTSLDGAAWVDQGAQNSGTQVVATTDTAPKLAIAAGEAGQWVDELVVWAGDKTQLQRFTAEELANLRDLADVFGDPMDQYEDNYGAPLCWQATARMPDGSAWRDSGCGPCPPVVRVPRGASDVVVTDDGVRASPRIMEG